MNHTPRPGLHVVWTHPALKHERNGILIEADRYGLWRVWLASLAKESVNEPKEGAVVRGVEYVPRSMWLISNPLNRATTAPGGHCCPAILLGLPIIFDVRLVLNGFVVSEDLMPSGGGFLERGVIQSGVSPWVVCNE